VDLLTDPKPSLRVSEAIHLFTDGIWKDGLLRFACNDATRMLESQEIRELE
jgi:hypothetical protein